MEFELKSVKFNERMTEETHCFSADLFIDGKKAFEVSNSGHGGENMVRQVGAITEADVNTWLAANRPTFGQEHGMSLKHNMEIEVGELMNKWLSKRELDKLMRKYLVTLGDDGSIYQRKYGALDMVSSKIAEPKLSQVVTSLASVKERLVTPTLNYDDALKAMAA